MAKGNVCPECGHQTFHKTLRDMYQCTFCGYVERIPKRWFKQFKEEQKLDVK